MICIEADEIHRCTQKKPELVDILIWLPLLDKFRTLNWGAIRQNLEFSGLLNSFSIEPVLV